ncbi:MAG: hypothetical protein AAGD86_04725, partial [Pseudomonadota bacterium]
MTSDANNADDSQQAATTANPEMQLAAATVALPEIADALVPYTDAAGEEREKLDALLAEIDLADS